VFLGAFAVKVLWVMSRIDTKQDRALWIAAAVKVDKIEVYSSIESNAVVGRQLNRVARP
jgi:hypothetical protein